MDSSRLLKYAYSSGTQTPQRNILYVPEINEYTGMINRLNRQNQSLSLSMITLLNQNEVLRKQLHQKRMEEMNTKQSSSSQIKSGRSYLNRAYKSGIRMQDSAVKQKQPELRLKTNSVHMIDNKKHQIQNNQKPFFVNPRIADQLAQQKLKQKRKKGLYLAKQISQLSQSATKQESRKVIIKQQQKQHKQINPQSIQKQSKAVIEQKVQQKKIQVLFRKPDSPFKLQIKPKDLDSRQSDKKQRKDHLQSMYSYLYSPIKTYNQIVYDKH